MKITVILAVLALLLAPDILAAGLQITEMDVNVDYDEAYTYRVENRDRIDSTTVSLTNNSKIDADILPGSNVTFTVRVENSLPANGNDIRGTFVRITIEDIDDGADLEEESVDFDLEPGDDERADVRFGIPLDVDAGTYNVIVEAEGEDKNDTFHKTKLNLKLEVKKQSHDIRITKVTLIPSFVDCSRKAKLTAQAMNLGSNLENQVALEFRAAGLGINSYDKDISLESSDEASEEEKTYTKTLNIEVPDFFRAGTFPILVSLYWKNFVLFDQKTVDLVVKDCVSKPVAVQEEKENKSEEVVVIQPGAKEEKPQEQSKDIITSTREVSLLSSPLFLSAILGGFAAVVLIILAVIVGYLKRKVQ